ncbi:MAG TPA: beta-phosphoglucomutase [Balneolaceae bacterium]|nr:beta-phosphoglucomutase [Balneolaceae bacterium]
MKIPRAWIFDLDGVIVETAQFHFKSWKKLADTLEIPFDETKNESLKGVSRKQSLQKILAMADRTISDKEFRRLMDQKNEWYQAYISKLTPADMLDGIPEFLAQLKTMNVKLAIGSSSKNAEYIINYLQLNEMFDTVIDGTKVTKTKPHPEIFLKGAETLGAEPEDCIVFEDAISGIQAAKEAGMTCVGVGKEKHLSQADLVITSFKNRTPKKLLAQLYN